MDSKLPDEVDRHRLNVLRAVLGAVNLGVVVLDGDARVVVWNAWMGRYSGLPRERVVGADFF
ncbi:MAG TPA: PAS domain-containing protein, partial [Duganella sp.]|nr:PAS domain-containing protein [Duganella sp.]